MQKSTEEVRINPQYYLQRTSFKTRFFIVEYILHSSRYITFTDEVPTYSFTHISFKQKPLLKWFHKFTVSIM
jgi:hypothetical protein